MRIHEEEVELEDQRQFFIFCQEFRDNSLKFTHTHTHTLTGTQMHRNLMATDCSDLEKIEKTYSFGF